ncbi:MAG: hypothetical protein HUJ22_04930 [Gracilimonas sp.]|uniref:hypothetical protein n=1 Tax=Gracilimonas sp. TaxID=1974203 RepID=UPI00198A23A5|nr:hypothetical protein [Gracilimonas sp.]MBD3615898.1 hypothetical protein [Gracilimonas sp.]
MQKLKSIGLMVCCLFAGVITAKLFFTTDNPEIEKAKTTTYTLPSITVFNLASEAINLSDDLSLDATNVLIIYALGCNSCISDAVRWAKIHESKKDSVNFIGLAYSSDREAVKTFIQTSALDFEHRLIDKYNANKIQINDWPIILGVDGNSNLLFKYEGDTSTDSLVSYFSKNN